MRASWGKHPLTCLLIILAFGAYCIDRAMQYSSSAPSEQSTIAHVYRFKGYKRMHCSYNFTVAGTAYLGGDCPWSTPYGHFDATVYYDPSKPSINSLDEFGAASKRWYQWAAASICSGCIIFGIVIWWGAFKKSRRGKSGSAADAEETVPDPDTIDRELQDSGRG